jgi:hypothetical protein
MYLHGIPHGAIVIVGVGELDQVLWLFYHPYKNMNYLTTNQRAYKIIYLNS